MKGVILICTALLVFANLSAQDDSPKKLDFNGYLNVMPQFQWVDAGISDSTISQNLIHNRLNIHFYANDNLTFSIQFRNQFIAGDLVPMGNYQAGFRTDNYYLPLSYYEKIGNKGVLSLTIDRLYAQYTRNDLEIKIGRQRINWGQTFAWNPNDIFNSYNFFDFDYMEKPGADALRIQYYTGFTSLLDLAVKIDNNKKITAAGLYRFNVKGVDIQLLSGYYTLKKDIGNNDKDFVAGMGFTTDIKGVSFRGESSYFHSLLKNDNSNIILASLGIDYTFSNDLMIVGEFLYNSKENQLLSSGLGSMYNTDMTVKELSFSKNNALLQLSYPVTPLINASLAGMYFFDNNLDGYYAGPTADISLAENVDLSCIAQYFKFNINVLPFDFNYKTFMGFVRVKWSF